MCMYVISTVSPWTWLTNCTYSSICLYLTSVWGEIIVLNLQNLCMLVLMLYYGGKPMEYVVQVMSHFLM